jgi:hypothetical protein
MFTLISLIKHLIPHLASRRESEEAYLAGSSDLFELERRMHAIQQ